MDRGEWRTLGMADPGNGGPVPVCDASIKEYKQTELTNCIHTRTRCGQIERSNFLGNSNNLSVNRMESQIRTHSLIAGNTRFSQSKHAWSNRGTK